MGGLLVGAADVQRGTAGAGRIELDIWGFGAGKRRVLVEHIEVEGSVADKTTWEKLDAQVAREWKTADGRMMKLARVGIDSGDGESTMNVYAWARRNPAFVLALKGRDTLAAAQAIAGPSWVDVTIGGRKLKRGVRLWTVGTSMLKMELYGQLQLEPPRGDKTEYPEGYVFLPDGTADEWIKQLVAEQLVTIRKRNGKVRQEWQTRPRNEALDMAVYARVAVAVGVDRLKPADWAVLTDAPAKPDPKPPAGAKKKTPPPKKPPPPKARAAPQPASNWLNRRGR